MLILMCPPAFIPAAVSCKLLCVDRVAIGVAAFVCKGLSEVPHDEDAIKNVPGLLIVDDDVSFQFASSDMVLIPIPLVLKPPKTKT